MKTKEFNNCYEKATKVRVVNDNWFVNEMWFWMNLTERQHNKMYDLMIQQGAQEVENAAGKKQIKLKNGIGIIKLS